MEMWDNWQRADVCVIGVPKREGQKNYLMKPRSKSKHKKC